MKKIVTVILLVFYVSGIAQVTDTVKYSVREDLLQKSKRQKTTAFVMLGVGAAAAVTGSIIFSQNFDIWSDTNDTMMGTGAILATAGGLSMLGSIPFFIASSKNKRQAMGMSAGVDIERAMPAGAYQSTYFPALNIRLDLK